MLHYQDITNYNCSMPRKVFNFYKKYPTAKLNISLFKIVSLTTTQVKEKTGNCMNSNKFENFC